MRPRFAAEPADPRQFPFLLGGTFIEAPGSIRRTTQGQGFPFLLGGTFIEADSGGNLFTLSNEISLPFGRDFH